MKISCFSLVSICLAQSLGTLAWAEPTAPGPVPSFAAPARAVGTYLIADVLSNSGGPMTSDCVAKADQSTDVNCGQTVWLVRTDSQLAILSALPAGSGDDIETSVFSGMLIHKKCTSWLPQEQALQGGVFSGDFCRAYLHNSPNRNGAVDTFRFGGQVPELAKLPSSLSALEALLLVTTGTTVGSEYSVDLPRGEASPATITITKRVGGTTVGSPSSFSKSLILRHVSN